MTRDVELRTAEGAAVDRLPTLTGKRQVDAAIAALIGETPMSREPRRPRSVKVEDDLWTDALAKADERGEILSEEIRRFLAGYVKR